MTDTITTCRAKVSNKIIEKANRLFKADPQTVFIELIQNARRAGATKLDFTITPETEETTQVVMQDNGHGVKDFSILLHLGESGWGENVQAKEDPAGMGFFSLAHYGAIVTSGSQSAVFSKEAFLGLADVTVRRAPNPVTGTRIAFTLTSDVHDVTQKLKELAEYARLEVTINGKEVTQRDFLEGAEEVIEHKGVRIGIYHDNQHRDRRTNFHGIRIYTSGVLIGNVFDRRERNCYNAVFDIVDTSFVKLTLPTREGVIDNEAWREVVTVAKKAIYGKIMQTPHTLAFAHYQEAKALGLDMPEAEPYLERSHPQAHYGDNSWGHEYSHETMLKVFPKDTILAIDGVGLSKLAGPSLSLHLATELEQVTDVRIFNHKEEMRGYSWYKKLPVLTKIEAQFEGKTVATVEGTQEDTEQDAFSPTSIRPEKIELVLHLQKRGGKTAKKVVLNAEAYFANISQDCNEPDGEDWALRKDYKPDRGDLVEMLTHSYFSPSSDYDIEPQEDTFHNEAIKCATEVLQGTAAAKFEAIRLALVNHTGDLREATSIQLDNKAGQLALQITLTTGETTTIRLN